MKDKVLVCTAIAALCSATTVAMGTEVWDPNLDELILIGDPQEGFFLNNGESISFDVTLEENGNAVVGFSFLGVWAGTGGAWASDTILTITDPTGGVTTRGGFPAPGGGLDWDFQGDISAGDGFYAHGVGGEAFNGDGSPDFAFDKIAKGGTWTFTFEQTWGTAAWKGVSIVLHKVPAPGALALLGLAGLVGARRRRQ